MEIMMTERRKYTGNLANGDSFWCGLVSVRPEGTTAESTHVTVTGREAYMVFLKRDDGTDCQADIEDLSFVRDQLFIDPPAELQPCSDPA